MSNDYYESHRGEWQWQDGEYTVTRTTAWSGPGCHDGCGVLYYTKDGKLEKVEDVYKRQLLFFEHYVNNRLHAGNRAIVSTSTDERDEEPEEGTPHDRSNQDFGAAEEGQQAHAPRVPRCV